MVKEKKITVKYFANTNLKQKEIDEQQEEVFPLYAMIIFDTKNAKFKVSMNGQEFYVPESMGKLGPEIESAIKRHESWVKKVVRQEYMLLQDRFSLRGLGKRLDKYQKDVRKLFAAVILGDLMEIVSDIGLSELNGFFSRFGELADCLNQLGSKDLTVFEWKFGKLQLTLEQCASKEKKFTAEELEKMIATLDRIVNSYMKD